MIIKVNGADFSNCGIGKIVTTITDECKKLASHYSRLKTTENSGVETRTYVKGGDIYNIVLQIGVGLAVIVGIVLGVKFILSSVEGKAEVKKMLITYVVSCVVIFGSFGIWKIVVTILQTV